MLKIISALTMFLVVLFNQLTMVNQSVKAVDNLSVTTVTAPVASYAADPWFTSYEGMYYYCYSYGNGVAVAKSENLSDLYNAERNVVWTAPEGTMYSRECWAPELHFIDGSWYIYVAADDGKNENHRMYVLRCEGTDPTKPFEFVGKITDSSDKWAIDGTVFQYKDEMYFIWSGWQGYTDGSQELYIAHMSSPTEIDSERVLISKPEKSWEKKGMPINEGPEILTDGNNIYLTYSASASFIDDYCIGMLMLTGDDPMQKSSWKKCPLPVFSGGNGIYSPGHASFVDGKDGSHYIVYHGNGQKGQSWGGRNGRIQKFEWKSGVPVFGKPVKDGSKIYFAE